MCAVWQIAAGDSSRRYDDIFINYDIMFMGPGNIGEFSKDLYEKKVKEKVIKSGDVTKLLRFCKEAEVGDLILLRTGHELQAIGILHQEGYKWRSEFDDILGWDLQHTRRVTWQNHLKDELEKIQNTKLLFSGRFKAFSKVDINKLSPIKPLLDKIKDRELKSLPEASCNPITLNELGKELFAKGLSNDSVDRLITSIECQRRLINWYHSYDSKVNRPSEHELIAHIVLPLLLALGWSEQLLAVEWHKVDLAIFNNTPRSSENCIAVCEAKYMNCGLKNTLEQPKTYCNKLKLNNCKKLIVTDGLRIYLHQKQNGDWCKDPCGYINLKKIRANHFIPENTNAVDTLMALTPQRIGLDM